MSALIGHAKAARILGHSLEAESDDLSRRNLHEQALILLCMARAHYAAATSMEQAMREEATGREETT